MRYPAKRQVLRAVLSAALVITLKGVAQAQGWPVADAITETNTTTMANAELPNILIVLQDIDKQDTETAISVTTGIQAGNFTPINASPYCQVLFNNDLMSRLVGWVPASNTSTLDAKTISDELMAVYQGAYADMQGLTGIDNTDALQIAKDNATATTLLAAVQINTRAQIMVIQELQQLRLAVIFAGTPPIITEAQTLDAVARARAKEECDANPNCSNPEQSQQ